jgi:hypothetical protein
MSCSVEGQRRSRGIGAGSQDTPVADIGAKGVGWWRRFKGDQGGRSLLLCNSYAVTEFLSAMRAFPVSEHEPGGLVAFRHARMLPCVLRIGRLMTHKYRGSEQSSREVKPNLLIRHNGSQRIFVSLNSGVVNSAAPGNILARNSLSVATVL